MNIYNTTHSCDIVATQVALGEPHFIEVKGVTFCGDSKGSGDSVCDCFCLPVCLSVFSTLLMIHMHDDVYGYESMLYMHDNVHAYESIHFVFHAIFCGNSKGSGYVSFSTLKIYMLIVECLFHISHIVFHRS